MKAMFTAVFLVLLAVAAPAQAPQGVTAGEAPFYTGVSDAASLRAVVERRSARADGYLKALLEVQGARTVDNTLVPYDRMGMEHAGAVSLARIVARLHPDEQMRTAAEELGQTLATKISALELRPDIYSALRAIDISNADPPTRRYVTRELRDLELAGVSKPEDVIHAVVGGQGRWHGINGIDIEGDVAEAPSTMLEEWIWDAPTLATFARHYQTDQPIPADLVQQMRRAGEFGRGLDSQRQAFLSKVSLSLHDKNQGAVDSTAVVREVSLKYNSMYPWIDGTYFQAQFTHLANGLYTSSYYTYLWSRVVAKDLFSQFDRTNLLAPAVAQRYRDAVLAPGGSKPAADLIGDFLGRPFRFDAYERWLNGENASATN